MFSDAVKGKILRRVTKPDLHGMEKWFISDTYKNENSSFKSC